MDDKREEERVMGGAGVGELLGGTASRGNMMKNDDTDSEDETDRSTESSDGDDGDETDTGSESEQEEVDVDGEKEIAEGEGLHGSATDVNTSSDSEVSVGSGVSGHHDSAISTDDSDFDEDFPVNPPYPKILGCLGDEISTDSDSSVRSVDWRDATDGDDEASDQYVDTTDTASENEKDDDDNEDSENFSSSGSNGPANSSAKQNGSSGEGSSDSWTPTSYDSDNSESWEGAPNLEYDPNYHKNSGNDAAASLRRINCLKIITTKWTVSKTNEGNKGRMTIGPVYVEINGQLLTPAQMFAPTPMSYADLFVDRRLDVAKTFLMKQAQAPLLMSAEEYNAQRDEYCGMASLRKPTFSVPATGGGGTILNWPYFQSFQEDVNLQIRGNCFKFGSAFNIVPPDPFTFSGLSPFMNEQGQFPPPSCFREVFYCPSAPKRKREEEPEVEQGAAAAYDYDNYSESWIPEEEANPLEILRSGLTQSELERQDEMVEKLKVFMEGRVQLTLWFVMRQVETARLQWDNLDSEDEDETD